MVEPPGPIPNPEVKRRSANGSETIGLVRVGRRQVYARPRAIGAGLFFARAAEMMRPPAPPLDHPGRERHAPLFTISNPLLTPLSAPGLWT